MNTATLKGNWNIARGKLQQKFPELTGQDLAYVPGQENELLRRIQNRTGRARAEIDKFIQDSGCELPPAHRSVPGEGAPLPSG